jgi:hypothetical protein
VNKSPSFKKQFFKVTAEQCIPCVIEYFTRKEEHGYYDVHCTIGPSLHPFKVFLEKQEVQ